MRRASALILRRAKDFLWSEEGPTATEYAVMLALIIVAAIGTVTTLGSTVKDIFKSIDTVIKKIPGGT